MMNREKCERDSDEFGEVWIGNHLLYRVISLPLNLGTFIGSFAPRILRNT